MGTKVAKIKKGDKFWCVHRKLPQPKLGTVFCLTNEPGKLVGLEFTEPLPEGLNHLDGDGRGKLGLCMWAHPDHMLSEAEYKAQQEAETAAKAARAAIKDLDELDVASLTPPAPAPT